MFTESRKAMVVERIKPSDGVHEINAYILDVTNKVPAVMSKYKEAKPSVEVMREIIKRWTWIVQRIDHVSVIRTLYNNHLDKTVLYYCDRMINQYLRLSGQDIDTYKHRKEVLTPYYNSLVRLNNSDETKFNSKTFYDQGLYYLITEHDESSQLFESKIEAFLAKCNCFDMNEFEESTYKPIRSTLTSYESQKFEIIKFLNHMLATRKPIAIDTSIMGSYSVISRNNFLIDILDEIDTLLYFYENVPSFDTIMSVVSDYNQKQPRDLFNAQCRRILNNMIGNTLAEQHYLLMIIKMLKRKGRSYDDYFKQLLVLNAVYDNIDGTYYIFKYSVGLVNKGLIQYNPGSDYFIYSYGDDNVKKAIDSSEARYIAILTKLKIRVYKQLSYEFTDLVDYLLKVKDLADKSAHEDMFLLYFKLFSQVNGLNRDIFSYIKNRVKDGQKHFENFIEISIAFAKSTVNQKIINGVLPLLVLNYCKLFTEQVDINNGADWKKCKKTVIKSLREMINLSLNRGVLSSCYEQFFHFRNDTNKELRGEMHEILIAYFQKDPHYYALKMTYFCEELKKKDDTENKSLKNIEKELGHQKAILDTYKEFSLLIRNIASCSKERDRKLVEDAYHKLVKFFTRNSQTKSYSILLPYLANKNRPIGDRVYITACLSYQVLSSVTWPVRLKCICSDDNTYSLLVKYDDKNWENEVKSFEILSAFNNILMAEGHNDMAMQLYNIEPIYSETIICEWLDNTQVFIDLTDKLIDDNGFNSKDDNLYNESQSNVLFKHLTETYRNPNVYFNHKTELTKSAAVWSISGSMFGLGDRHMGNIMLSQVNSKIIHIDLAYIMELARYSLKVPELVPFRFTLNFRRMLGLLDGNGLFFYYCITALKAYSKYSHYLISKYYSFINNTQLKYMQDKALEIKDIGGSDMYQYVADLIKKAINEHNLKEMFKGWGPKK
jgi:hypothetical protein